MLHTALHCNELMVILIFTDVKYIRDDCVPVGGFPFQFTVPKHKFPNMSKNPSVPCVKPFWTELCNVDCSLSIGLSMFGIVQSRHFTVWSSSDPDCDRISSYWPLLGCRTLKHYQTLKKVIEIIPMNCPDALKGWQICKIQHWRVNHRHASPLPTTVKVVN